MQMGPIVTIGCLQHDVVRIGDEKIPIGQSIRAMGSVGGVCGGLQFEEVANEVQPLDTFICRLTP